jgi:hypothetical protein
MKCYSDNWAPVKSASMKNLGYNHIPDVMSCGYSMTGAQRSSQYQIVWISASQYLKGGGGGLMIKAPKKGGSMSAENLEQDFA